MSENNSPSDSIEDIYAVVTTDRILQYGSQGAAIEAAQAYCSKEKKNM